MTVRSTNTRTAALRLSTRTNTPCAHPKCLNWVRLNVQRHHVEKVSGVMDISDAHQFNNGIMGANRSFDVARPDEVFVTVEAEVGYTTTGHRFDCCIFCRCETRGRCHCRGLVDNVAGRNINVREVDAHAGCRVQDLGQADARGASR